MNKSAALKLVKWAQKDKCEMDENELTKSENKLYKLLLKLGNGDRNGAILRVNIRDDETSNKLNLDDDSVKDDIDSLIIKGYVSRDQCIDILNIYIPITKTILTKKDENKLYEWAEAQKHDFWNGKLTNEQIKYLESLPRWDWISDKQYKKILIKMAKNKMDKPNKDTKIGRKLSGFTNLNLNLK